MKVARLYMQRMRQLRKKYPKMKIKHLMPLVRDYADHAYHVPLPPTEEMLKEAREYMKKHESIR